VIVVLLLVVVPGLAALVAGIDANHRDGDWAFPWQGSLLALGTGHLALLVATLAMSLNPLLATLLSLTTVASAVAVVLYAMQADNHPRERKPFQPDRFPTGRG
jgi:hypothetical protein